MRLTGTLQAWGTPEFEQTLKAELTEQGGEALPLERATTQGGMVDASKLAFTVISSRENSEALIIRVGVFFTEIVICCGCGDDPFETNGYGVLEMHIDKTTAVTTVCLVPE